MVREFIEGAALLESETASAFLLRQEAANNLLLWLMGNAGESAAHHYLGAVVVDRQVTALALQSSVQLVLSTTDDLDAVAALAEDMSARGLSVERLNGPREVAQRPEVLE